MTYYYDVILEKYNKQSMRFEEDEVLTFYTHANYDISQSRWNEIANEVKRNVYKVFEDNGSLSEDWFKSAFISQMSVKGFFLKPVAKLRLNKITIS